MNFLVAAAVEHFAAAKAAIVSGVAWLAWEGDPDSIGAIGPVGGNFFGHTMPIGGDDIRGNEGSRALGGGPSAFITASHREQAHSRVAVGFAVHLRFAGHILGFGQRSGAVNGEGVVFGVVVFFCAARGEEREKAEESGSGAWETQSGSSWHEAHLSWGRG
jgi:hypothetical protein